MATDGSNPADEFNTRIRTIFDEALRAAGPGLIAAAGQHAANNIRDEIQTRIAQAKAEVDAYAASKGPAPSPPPSTALKDQPSLVPDAPLDLAGTIRWAINSLPLLLATSLDSYDKLVTIRLKQTSPFAILDSLSQSNPRLVQFAAQMYAPDPLERYIPGILAQNTLQTSEAVTRALLRQGAVVIPKGGKPTWVGPFDEASDDTDESSDASPAPTARMTAKPPIRKVTLREALR